MKKFLICSVALFGFVVCWKPLTVFAEFDKHIRNQIDVSPGKKLILDLETGGAVVIYGWERNVVSVTADMSGENAQDFEFQMNQISDGVRVRSIYVGKSNLYSTSFHFNINVPRKFDVALHSSGGDLKIVRVNGILEGTTGGGDIRIEEAKGKINLSTGGGEIHVVRSEMNGDVSTGGGDIYFEDVEGEINGSTGSGRVWRDHRNVKPIRGQTKRGGLRIEKAGGEIYIKDAPDGIYANTGGGEIRIGSAKGFVSVQTGGGNISLDSIDGQVEATTGAGDVRVKMISGAMSSDHDIDISSGIGDITLVVPPSFSMDLDLKIGFTNEAERYDIISDFAINKRTTQKYSELEGTPRKYIYGTGKVGGGKNRIRISTVNGNIYLKKS